MLRVEGSICKGSASARSANFYLVWFPLDESLSHLTNCEPFVLRIRGIARVILKTIRVRMATTQYLKKAHFFG